MEFRKVGFWGFQRPKCAGALHLPDIGEDRLGELEELRRSLKATQENPTG